MKKSVWMIIGVGAALAMSASSFAQSAGPIGGASETTLGGAKHAGGGPLAWMLRTNREILPKLNLSPAQVAQLKTLTEKCETDAKDIHMESKGPNAAADKAEAKEKIKALLKEYREGLIAILSPAQQAQYKALWKEAMEKRKTAAKP